MFACSQMAPGHHSAEHHSESLRNCIPQCLPVARSLRKALENHRDIEHDILARRHSSQTQFELCGSIRNVDILGNRHVCRKHVCVILEFAIHRHKLMEIHKSPERRVPNLDGDLSDKSSIFREQFKDVMKYSAFPNKLDGC